MYFSFAPSSSSSSSSSWSSASRCRRRKSSRSRIFFAFSGDGRDDINDFGRRRGRHRKSFSPCFASSSFSENSKMDNENNVNFSSSSSLSSSKQEAPLLVLTFDLDDTIWPTTPVVTAANESYIEWLQSRVESFPETKVMNQLMKGIREEREEMFRERGEEHVVSFSFRFFFFFFFFFFFALASRVCAC